MVRGNLTHSILEALCQYRTIGDCEMLNSKKRKIYTYICRQAGDKSCSNVHNINIIFINYYFVRKKHLYVVGYVFILFVEANIKCVFKGCAALWILSSCRRFRIIMTIFPVKWRKKKTKFHTLTTYRHTHTPYSLFATPWNFRHFEFPSAIYISLRCSTMLMFIVHVHGLSISYGTHARPLACNYMYRCEYLEYVHLAKRYSRSDDNQAVDNIRSNGGSFFFSLSSTVFSST